MCQHHIVIINSNTKIVRHISVTKFYLDSVAVLLAPGLFRRGVPSGDPAESQTFSDVAAGIIQIAVDRTQLTGAV
jgi:hypothetical protein